MFNVKSINVLKVSATACLCLCVNSAFSASSSQLYFGLGNAAFDPAIAFTQGVEDDALALEFGYEKRLHSGFVWGAGINWYAYSDNNGFSVQTEGVFGGVERSDSSASGLSGFGELGYSYTPSKKIELSLMAGYELMLSSSRSVSNCSNCPSEDIDIDTGAYFNPKVVYTFDNMWTLGLSYNSYVSSDVESLISIQLGKRFSFLGGSI